MTAAWSPNIIGFACRYCAYIAADVAGSMRLQYPADIKLIMVPCTAAQRTFFLLERG